MKVFGIIIVASALLIAGISQVYNCQAEGKYMTTMAGTQVPMKCYWTAMAELATGASLLVLGGLMFFSKRRESSRNLAAMGIALGAVTMLLPTVLIGVCAAGMMGGAQPDCNLVMLPAMLMLGGITIAASLGAFFYGERRLAPA